ncbi:Pyridoxine/pyridoxamine 5'-phosphate oxidase 2 (AtPPOX1) [Durusdinium trenchii]|uniref:Pyridoxine/pyridoxamine 5'-phosphate oxidase 2 (AtPPOX1) n=1 Tax=Durusdinium trenchii TaxID=1381693 RepID=A0ABP0KYC8_9DINO
MILLAFEVILTASPQETAANGRQWCEAPCEAQIWITCDGKKRVLALLVRWMHASQDPQAEGKPKPPVAVRKYGFLGYWVSWGRVSASTQDRERDGNAFSGARCDVVPSTTVNQEEFLQDPLREAKRKQLQLAMVDPATLAPTVRTVVFRGFARLETESTDEQESCIMVLISDERAQKVRHIQEGFPNSRVEICWWLDEAGVQFRIAGQALVACADTADEELQQLRRKVWQRLKPSTRQTFSWPQPGASLRAEVKALKADVLATDAGEIDLQVKTDADGHDEPLHFAVALVVPFRVDELHLGGRQKRFVHELPCFREEHMQLP